MRIYKEVDAMSIETWGNARHTVQKLDMQELDTVLDILEDCYPEGIDGTALNDFLSFDTDTIAEWLGYADWEELERDR